MTNPSETKLVETPRVSELSKHERHDTRAETFYWCGQYADLARQLERELILLQAAHDLGWAHKKCPVCDADMMTEATALASLADELRLARENERHAAQQVIEWSQIAAEEKEDAERARERIKELEKPLRLVIQCERHRGDPTIFKTFSQSYVGSYCPQCEDEAALKEPL